MVPGAWHGLYSANEANNGWLREMAERLGFADPRDMQA
jgi:hypothetical protein